MVGGMDTATTNFLAGVFVARCKDAATTHFLGGIVVVGCEDAAPANFQAAFFGTLQARVV